MKVHEQVENTRRLKRQLEVLTYKRYTMIYTAKGIKNAIKVAKVEGRVEKVKRCAAIYNGLSSSIRINKEHSRQLKRAI